MSSSNKSLARSTLLSAPGMADSPASPTSPEPRPKRRKLRYTRTPNACGFCKRRKVRCSGTYPCDMCIREEAVCEYAGGPPPSNSTAPTPGAQRSSPAARFKEVISPDRKVELDGAPVTTDAYETIVVSRASVSPPQTFGTNHIGPTSGVSFLHYTDSDPRSGEREEDHVHLSIAHAPLISWGDLPRLDRTARSALPDPTFTVEQILAILDRYFQYVSPTFRFLHYPTVKQWALAMVSRGKLSAAQKAGVLLVCAQTLLSNSAPSGDQSLTGGRNLEMSKACAELAKNLLENEPGPPSLTSVQSRLALCMYLLSTFRLNECRYCFSFAVTVATSLGIHRRQPPSVKMATLESESRKRICWSVFLLDGYISVMLGQPKLLRDEDIDQAFPNNISDSDLTSSQPIEDLPRHGDLEAFISHAKLAKLMARSNDLLYPLHSLLNHQLLQRSNDMVDALLAWQDELPTFLQARKKTFTGLRTFERQNTILKLAWAHARILTTRRCLLMDFNTANAIVPSHSQDTLAQRCIRECISAIVMILETVEVLMESGQCNSSFWTTQYIALVAISTLYVLMIQGVRHALPGDIESFLNVKETFDMAKRCHNYLATLPPPGSQAERHQVLLSHLRTKAERSLTRRKMPNISSRTVPQSINGDEINATVPATPGESGRNENDTLLDPQSALPDGLNQGGSNDLSMFGSIMTPNSSADDTFQYLLEFGWESLDAIGASMRDYELQSV